MWTQEQAVDLCRKIEPIVARFGCHVALTGGLLYKNGPRKDCDLIVYRAGLEFGDEPRGPFFETVDRDALFEALKAIDISVNIEHTRVVKAYYGLKDMRLQHVDFIFPECDGEYEEPVETGIADESKPVAGVDDLSQFAPIVETSN